MSYRTPIKIIAAVLFFFCGCALLQADSTFSDKEIAESCDMSSLEVQPKPVKQKPPTVPPELRNLKASVQIGFIIDEKGRVVRPRVVKSSNVSFDEVSLRCIRDWEFEPGQKDGQPVKVRVVVPLRYK